MLETAFITLLSLIAGALLVLSGQVTPPALAHLVFAVGIVPLIFAAMIHFVPVLTRTGDPGRWAGRLPRLAQVAGLLAVLAMQGVVPRWLLHLAVLCDLILAAALLNWIAGRARLSLGSPHPGWRWYGAALGCLMLALLSVLLISVWPAYWRALRAFHLHLNTVGLVGLAALGTLPVLLPTTLGKPDPEAAGWLHRRLWPVAGGALIVATGAAVVWPFGVPGAALVLVTALGLLGHWVRRFGLSALLADGAATPLLAAVCGLMLSLGVGVAHGASLMPAWPTLLVWGAGFLLPLVSGAVSQLLPVWRWPGPATPERLLMRSRLVAGGRWRAVFFLASALFIVAGHEPAAWISLGLAFVLFALNLLQAMRVRPPSR